MNKQIENFEYFNKVKRVVQSCETNQQKLTAINYLKRAIDLAPNRKIKAMLQSLYINAWK